MGIQKSFLEATRCVMTTGVCAVYSWALNLSVLISNMVIDNNP